jgi:hypothetical protein
MLLQPSHLGSAAYAHTDQCIQESDASRLSKSFLMISRSMRVHFAFYSLDILFIVSIIEATLVSDATVGGHYFICRVFKTISTPACEKLWTASAAHMFLHLDKSLNNLLQFHKFVINCLSF